MGNYDINSINHLETREAMRTRIQVYLGSDDTEGMYQALKEIINNSTDEALAGYGKEICIQVNEETNEITVRDYGRGVPYGIKDGRNILVAIYTESHTGGKFDGRSYKNSSGLNGLGGTAVCLSSEHFLVKSIRDGKIACATFKKGILNEYYESAEEYDGTTGTIVAFRPDKEVFKNATENYSYDRICEEIKNISYLNKGIKFIVDCVDGRCNEFYSKNGIADFIKEKAVEPLMSKPIIISKKDDEDEIEIAFMWTKGQSNFYVFVNGLMCPEGGSPITGAKTSITSNFKKLSKKDIEPDLIRKGLVYAINCKVANPSFANQTKSKINNSNLRTLASVAFKEGLEIFANSSEFNKIVDILLTYQKAEKAAEKAKNAVLSHNKEMQTIRKQKLAFIEKLKDCEKLGENSVLLCVEGDSAASMVAKARDTQRFGLLALRGKLINCLSNPEERYLINEEIKLLLYAMNIDINHYNPSKLRYGKIGICVDGDLDGSHIALLIMAALHKLCPQLLKENRLCWLRAPLFTEKKGKTNYYYYSEEEKNKNYHGGEVVSLKGLGSMSPEEMEESMFSKNQRLEVLTYSDEAAALLEQLMGENVAYRKEFIFNNIDFSKYTDI